MDRDDNDVKGRLQNRFPNRDTDSDDDGDDEDSLGEFPDMGVDESVKKEWPAVNMYLPAPLRDEMNDAYRDFRYHSDDQLQKGRHYYPLIARLGFERLIEMDIDEVKERLEEWDSNERNDGSENNDGSVE